MITMQCVYSVCHRACVCAVDALKRDTQGKKHAFEMRNIYASSLNLPCERAIEVA